MVKEVDRFICLFEKWNSKGKIVVLKENKNGQIWNEMCKEEIGIQTVGATTMVWPCGKTE